MPGEEVLTALKQLCLDQKLNGGFISGLGAAKEVEIAHFSMETKQYTTKTFKEVEVTALVGNISVDKLHLHVTVGDKTLQAYAGHCMKLVVDPTMELMITPFALTQRKLDEYSGLNLLDLDHTL